MATIMRPAGHRFQYSYENGVKLVNAFADEHTLYWKAIAGPEQGRSATETYDSVSVAPNVHFITWLEADGAAVSQVADYNQMIVYTSLIYDDNRVFLCGRLNLG
jgi:phenolic acid decarboxylase